MYLDELIRKFDQHSVAYRAAKANMAQHKAAAEAARQALKDISDSVAYVNEAIKLTQDQIKGQIESLVTVAMDAVFDQHYDFELQFSRVGNRLDCKAVLKDGEREMDDPEFDVGGSRVDTVSIALRVSVWSLEDEQPRGVFILDEPFTSLGNSYLLDRVLEIVQRLSRDLGLQMIVLTHIERAQAIADRAWHVTNISGKAIVELVTGEPDSAVTERIRA